MTQEAWTILIIDNSPDGRAEVRRMLLAGSDRRYTFIEAETGAAGRCLCDGADCVLLDDGLPDIDAPALLTALRQGGEMTCRPVIVLTDTAARERTAGVLQVGAIDALSKRWMNPESLTHAVEYAIERFALQCERQQAEQARHESEERFRALAEAMPHFVWETDANGEATYENARWYDYTGLTHAQTGHGGWLTVQHPDDAPRLAEAWATAVRTGGEYDTDCRFRRASDGAYRWFRVKGAPIRNDAGQIVHWVGTCTDVQEKREAEEARRDSEEKLRLFIEHAPVAVAMFDHELRYLAVSHRWMQDYELTGEIVGRCHYDIFPEIPDRWKAIHRRCLAGAVEKSEEDRFDRADGSTHWLKWEVRPWRNSAGAIGGLVIFSEDITARKRVEESMRESEQRFRLLADNISQFAWMADGKGRSFWYNQRWYDYTGTTLEQMQGWGWKQVHHPDHLDRVVERFQRSLDTGEPWEDTFPLRGKDGAYRWFLSRALPICDEHGHIVQWFGTNTDVTEQLAAEEALREADRRKDEFLAMLAHELRNPLAPIRSAVQILNRLGPVEPKQQWARDVIARQVKHLARLVDDLLDIARLIRGQIILKKEPLELATIVQQAVEAAQPLLEARQHHFRLTLPDSPVWLEGDPVRLVQVLLNLLDNAAKYTEPGGQIELEAECRGVEVAVRVRDTGPGLSPALLSQAFELFAQGERTLDRAQGGLGIGLTLVRRLVELHGGRVEAHSAGLEQGAEFTVWLPIRAMDITPDLTLTTPPETARPAPNPRILLVDNDPDVLESLALLLHLEGFDVKAATTGPAALDLARQFQPQVVLLDLGMPGMDGYEVARRLQERPPHQRPQRLIALTGYGDEETRRRVQEAGFTQHLVKPVELSVLVTLLRAES